MFEEQMQSQLNNACQNKQADIYDQHRQAVADWHKACKEFARAEAQRNQANEALDKISHALADSIAVSIQDPTRPPKPEPANGQIGYASQQGTQLRQY